MNKASGLSGADYVRNNQADATQDGPVVGRWVAVDESGWDGEQLYARTDRYLSIGSVAVDDTVATLIVDGLRKSTGLDQPPELKFAQLRARRDRLDALARLIEPEGPLGGRASVYLLDKHYFVTSKIIDLLLEEEAHKLGINLYERDFARRCAWTLFNEGPSALSRDGFNRLIETVVNFASTRNRDARLVTTKALFAELKQAAAAAQDETVALILKMLLRTRVHARRFLATLGSSPLPAMEPLIPCLPMIGHSWSESLGAVSVLVDEHRVLTDDRLDMIARRAALDVELAGPSMGVRRRPPSGSVVGFVRGNSRAHPSVQLADLIAGAGQAVARRHAGAPSLAGERLVQTVVPLISRHSLVPHDSPARFARCES